MDLIEEVNSINFSKEKIEIKKKEIEDEIKKIMNENSNHTIKLKYAYQPICKINNFGNIYSYQVFGFEALIRNTEYYNMSIFSFLNHFIKIKKGFLLHLYLFDLALKNFHKIKESNNNYLFFNLAPEIFVEDDFNFQDFYLFILYNCISPQNIVFEITENYSIDLFDAIVKKIKNINFPIKFKIAIDDFGTGSNNGKLFFELNPDFVKIDKYFIQNKKSFFYLKHLIESFYGLTNLILEGIETEDDFIRCIDLNIDLFQGYFFGKPFISY